MTTGQLDDALRIDLQAPRIERRATFRIAGIRRVHPLVDESVSALGDQWRDTEQGLARLERDRGIREVTRVGVFDRMFDGSDEFTHHCGIELVDDLGGPLPDRWEIRALPALDYLVFPHPHHVDLLQKTVRTAWFEWLPASRHTSAAAPSEGVPEFVERYGPGFDPETGEGPIEAWFPIAR